MKNFGFSVKQPRYIDFDTLDTRILHYVLEKEPSFNICMSCGCCTATCSASNVLDFNIRQLGLLLRRGVSDELEREINKCMLCGKCNLVCPRGINTRNVILNIKKALTKINENEL
jgi:heterodisulfide reductase subunit C